VLSRGVHDAPVIRAYPPRQSSLARNATRRRRCEKPTVEAHHSAPRHVHHPGAAAPASILHPEPSPDSTTTANAQPLPLHKARRLVAVNHHHLRRYPHCSTSIHGAPRHTTVPGPLSRLPSRPAGQDAPRHGEQTGRRSRRPSREGITRTARATARQLLHRLLTARTPPRPRLLHHGDHGRPPTAPLRPRSDPSPPAQIGRHHARTGAERRLAGLLAPKRISYSLLIRTEHNIVLVNSSKFLTQR
jgi:hypothetical protein